MFVEVFVDRGLDGAWAMLFTVMPCGASSTAMVRISILTPPLAAQ